MKTPDEAPPPILQLAELVSRHRVAMLTTRELDDNLQSRPMTPLELDAQGNFWFFCDEDRTALPATIRRSPKVNLAFSDESRSTYVSVHGSAVIEHDPERVRELWSVMARPWFPEGPETPGLVLMRVHCACAEVWDAPDSTLVRTLALAASVVAGQPVGLGEHDVIVPTPQPAT
jgi:general stress protein 26